MLQRIFAFALLTLTAACHAQTPAPTVADAYQAGRDYQLIEPPVPTSSGDKIEVQEIFGYWCIHCAHADPVIKEWKVGLPADVAFSYVPAMYQPGGVEETFARAYYTAETMGLLDKTHTAMFQATAVERKIRSADDIIQLYVDQGVSKADFEATMNSFAVNAKVARVQQNLPRYKISGTPTMIVNGKYRVMAPQGGSFEAMLKIVDFLVAQERAAKKS